jgi:transposase
MGRDQCRDLPVDALIEVILSLQAFGLILSAGAIANALARLADRARPAYAAIAAAVRGSPVQGSDETRARVKGQYRCHGVFQTEQASCHLIATTKGAAVIDDLLAGAEPEGWISDLAPAHLGAPAAAQQLCLAHPTP